VDEARLAGESSAGRYLPNPVCPMNVALETHGLTRDFGAFRYRYRTALQPFFVPVSGL
jgi:hypothetical protein